MIVALTGGLRTSIYGVRLTITSGTRLFLWAIVVASIRHWFYPRHPVLRRFGPVQNDVDGFFARSSDQVTWTVPVVGLAGILLTILMTWPQTARLDAVPDIGDPVMSAWRLAWVNHQIVRDPFHLFDANIFFPERRTLAFTDSTIIPDLMAAPLLWTGVNPITAYNVVFLSSFLLSFFFTFLFVRRLVGDSAAAAVAAVIFGFYPFRFEHYAHFELQMSFWIPLALWAFHRTLELGRLADGVLTGLAIAAQTLSSMYYGLFFVTYLIPVTLVVWKIRRPPARAWGSLTVGAVLALVIIMPVAWPYFLNRSVLGERQFSEVSFYSATLTDYFSSHTRSLTWGWLPIRKLPERQLFPGIATIVLAIVGLWPPFSILRLAYASGLAVALDISLGFNGMLYNSLYTYVVPYRGLRVPARVSILVGFTLALFAAWGVRRLLSHVRSRRSSALFTAVLVTIILLESVPSLRLESIWRMPPAAYGAMEPGAVVAEFPTPSDDTIAWYDTRYMYFSTFHWRRLLNGTSGFLPASYHEFVDRMLQFPNPDSLAYLKSRGVNYVVVHGAFLEPDRYARIRATLDARSDISLALRFTWEGREGSVYRVSSAR